MESSNWLLRKPREGSFREESKSSLKIDYIKSESISPA
jgi:hypothetical protein